MEWKVTNSRNNVHNHLALKCQTLLTFIGGRRHCFICLESILRPRPLAGSRRPKSPAGPFPICHPPQQPSFHAPADSGHTLLMPGLPQVLLSPFPGIRHTFLSEIVCPPLSRLGVIVFSFEFWIPLNDRIDSNWKEKWKCEERTWNCWEFTIFMNL